jgi:hypothetical protein
LLASFVVIVSTYNKTTMAEVHEDRFIPERHKLDQLSIVKDYATVPRLEYRYVAARFESLV